MQQNEYKNYKKLGNAGKKGTDFQISLLTMVLLNGLKRSENWYLSTENKAAGKFDDIVVEYSESKCAILIQAKHKETKNVTYLDLISDSSQNDFSLPKYFCSYQEIKVAFKIQNIIICTNANINKKVKDVVYKKSLSTKSLLHFGIANVTFYTFKESFSNELKQSVKKYYVKNLPDKKMEISDESIATFLSHLQLIVDFPTGNCLNQALENIFSQTEFAQELNSKTCTEHIHKTMDTWYGQLKGRYLSRADARAFLCEVRTNKYWGRLKSYNISFKNCANPLNRSKEKVFYIISEHGFILSVIRVYQAFQEQDLAKVLFLDLDEEINTQKQIIEAFNIPNYIYLIIVCNITVEEDIIREICPTLVNILKNSNYKNVVLIAEKENSLIKSIKSENINIFEVRENIKFSDLTEEFQEKFREMKNIVFQGNDTSLNELFATSTNEELNDFIYPEMLVKYARNQKISVGLKVSPLEQNIRDYYIHRMFHRNKNSISEKRLCHWYESSEDRIVLISDSPGTGKSTTLGNLAATLKENSPNFWLIKLDINNYTDVLLKFYKENLSTITMEDILRSQENTRPLSDFEKKIFSFLKKIFIIDGVDEISPDYKDIILNLLIVCKKDPTVAKIFIATRPHLCKELEYKLQVKPWTLKPFTKENQVNFLTRYWILNLALKENAKKNKCRDYAQTLMEIIWQISNAFSKVPLQLRMLAEIFQEKTKFHEGETRIWDTCDVFLTLNNNKPKLPNKLDVVELYEMFIDKKYDTFVNYYKNKLSGYRKIFIDSDYCHHILALETILDSKTCELFDCYKKQIKNFDEEHLLKLGIVQKTDNKIHFMHRTFAEYFTAKCLIEQLKCESTNEEFQVFFVNDVLTLYQFHTIRIFLNGFLRKEMNYVPNEICKAIGTRPMFKNTFYNLAKENSTDIFRFLFKCLDSAKLVIDINTVKINGRTVFHGAAEAGSLDMVYLLLKKGVKVNCQDEDGRTALHEAAAQKNLNMIQNLMDLNIDINIKDKYGRTALHEAVLWDSSDIVKCLVEKGAEINSEDNDSRTPLYEAALRGYSDPIKYLLSNGANINNTTTKDGRTALHEAVAKDNLTMVKILVKMGAETNIKDKYGYTVLYEAVCRKNFKIIQYLIHKRADVDTKNSLGCPILHKVVGQGSLDTVKYFVENGAEVNCRNSSDETALYVAVTNGYLNIVKCLIENGADVNCRVSRSWIFPRSKESILDDESGLTVLHKAITKNNLEIIEYLIENGADLSIKTKFAGTALHHAVEQNNLAIVKFLVEKGAEINSRDNLNRTALHIATYREYLNTIKYLLEKGAIE